MHQPDQYLDFEQSAFTWFRADRGYYFDDKARLEDPKPLMNQTPQKKSEPPYLLETLETTGFIRSRVIEQELALFLKFAEVQPTKENTLAFANEYGMLTPGKSLCTPKYSYLKGKKAPRKHGIAILSEKKDDKRVYGVVYGESLNFWKKELHDMALTVKVWEWVKNQDISALTEVIHWNKDGTGVNCKLDKAGGWLASNDYHQEVFARFRQGDILLPAKYLVQSRINKKLRQHTTRPRILLGNNNRLEPYFMPESLIAAMWFQFFQAAVGETKFKRCLICGQWADVTQKNRNWSKHPECANRERVRKNWEKNRKKQA